MSHASSTGNATNEPAINHKSSGFACIHHRRLSTGIKMHPSLSESFVFSFLPSNQGVIFLKNKLHLTLVLSRQLQSWACKDQCVHPFHCTNLSRLLCIFIRIPVQRTAIHCSHLSLQTAKVGASLSYNIHYWIGSQSTQDEQGAAAVYTIQLDEYLGGSPVQHREVQGYESDSFRGYFKQGVMWVPEKMWGSETCNGWDYPAP